MQSQLIDLMPHDVKWITRRMPKPVREVMKYHQSRVVLAGGFIRSCIANEPVNDVDLVVDNKEFAQQLINELAGGDTDKVYTTDNAYSVRIGETLVQVIHRWVFNSPQEVINSFDFTIAKAAVWFHCGRWHGICDQRFYPDLAAKRLVYCSPIRNEDAGGSLLRLLKFYSRGYRAPLNSVGDVIARLVMAVDMYKVQRENKRETEDQLGRVLTGLLIEVDPNSILVERSYLPAETEEESDV